MEMTIEKAIEWYDGLECYTPQAKDAKDVAIDTMRKYQKIEEIVHIEMNGKEALQEIERILRGK